MACELVLASSFVELKTNLLERIRILCKEQPFSAKWILTPTAAVAEHCKLSLSDISSETVLAGVHVLPLSRFLGTLLKSSRIDYIPRYHPTLDLLLYSLVQRLSMTTELGEVGRHPTGFIALRSTFLDLADGGFGLEQADLLKELSSEADLMEVEKLVLSLYVAWLKTLEAANLNWEPLAHQQLARWITEVPENLLQQALSPSAKASLAELFLYGFYDFTDVNTQIIAALGKRLKLALYFPYRAEAREPHPAFSFSHMVLRDLKTYFGASLGDNLVAVDGRPPDPVTSFFADTFPRGDCQEQPGFLTAQQASGIRAEVISAAVTIRKWLDDDGDAIRANGIMLLAPDSESYDEEVREIFSAFSIPLSPLDRPSQGDPDDRALLMLKRLWTSKGDPEWLLTLFREYPTLLSRRHIDLEQFETRLREFPISAGEVWKRLSILLLSTDQSSLPSFNRPEIDLISEIVEVWVQRPKAGIPIDQARRLMQKISEFWIEDSAPLQPAQEALEVMAELLPTLNLPEDVFGMLFSQPKKDQSVVDPFGQPGVLFSSIMRARGITGRAIVILGLSLGRFPARVEEDPLLSDSSRNRLKRLAQDVGHRLAVKSRVIDEMNLLFFLLNTSARRIHWVIPQTDESGKNVVPTPWVQHYLHSWKTLSGKKQVPRGPIEQALFLYSLDSAGGSMLPPAYLPLLGTQMFTGPQQNKSDPDRCGQIEASRFSVTHHPERLAVTELELLAQCPFHFYSAAVAGWKMIRPLSFVVEPDALEWGRLVHRSLERHLRPHLGKKVSLRHLALDYHEAPWFDLDGLANDIPAKYQLLAEPLRLALARRLSMTIDAYLEAVRVNDCADGHPLAQEVKIRMPYPGKEYLTISGQIDRVDIRNGKFHIIDYKSGREPWSGRADRDSSFELGHRLQPLLYPRLYALQASVSDTPEFSFVFLANEPPKEVPVSKVQNSEILLLSLATLLERGSFIPTSSELMREWGLKYANPCQYCQLDSLCRRFDGAQQSRSGRYFRTLARQRFEAMTRQVSHVQ